MTQNVVFVLGEAVADPAPAAAFGSRWRAIFALFSWPDETLSKVKENYSAAEHSKNLIRLPVQRGI